MMADLLKNLYNTTYINLLTNTLSKHYFSFEKELFIEAIFNPIWKEKELKQRMRHTATQLGLYLPKEYLNASKILKLAFSDMNYDYGLQNMIFQDFIEVYGLDDFEISMDALAHFTINSSSEFAIRAFILKYPQETMQQMMFWATSSNEHLRRLASEGSRPRLPWAVSLPAFKENPSEVFKILEILKDDTSKYVQKSVANCLNDISKDNPEIVIELTKKWKNKTKTREWILKHGCRTLLKDSNTEILSLFGFQATTSLALNNFQCNEEVRMNHDLNFSFELSSQKNIGTLRIEFALYFLRKNGQHNKKVFKIAEGIYADKEKVFTKSYSFKKITTRVYYKGSHKLQIIINGVVLAKTQFMLT